MKSNLITNLMNLIALIVLIVVATLRSLPRICKYGYTYISKYVKEVVTAKSSILY